MAVIALFLALWLVLNVGLMLAAMVRSDGPPTERRPRVGELRIVRRDEPGAPRSRTR